jgi:nucleoside-diphosphate-sugar epimerase
LVGNFWTGKRVVLLGGASLIGTHLAHALLEKNIRRLTIVDDFSSGSFENVKDLVNQHVNVIRGDLRIYNTAFAAVTNEDIIFHMAAQHGGRGYVAGHKVELYDNLSLDATIFRACAEAHVEKVIFSSSACAYPIELQTDPKKLLYLSEDMIDYDKMLDADGPYGREKLLGEMMLDAYIERGAFQGCSTRSFTVYGPLMKENHAIAALIAKTLIMQSPFEIWGDGKQIRNWTYVQDNVAGALLAAEHLNRGAINIGVEDRMTPRDAALMIWDIMDWHPEAVDYHLNKPVGPKNRVADASRLKALGWEPRYTFEEGLRKTIDWYLSTHTVDEVRKDFERKLTER